MGVKCSCCKDITFEYLRDSIENPLVSIKLGSGTFGDVYQIGGLAVKRFKKSIDAESAVQEIANLGILSEEEARRNHIVFMHGVFSGDHDVLIAMDCHEQALDDWIVSNKAIDKYTEFSYGFVRQITTALEWLHERGVAHRDLKSGNVLITGDKAYLGDLGHACVMGRAELPWHSGKIVSAWYRPPECLFSGIVKVGPEGTLDPESGLLAYGCELDIWALGAMMAEVASSGVHPFAGKDEKTTFHRIFKVLGTPKESVLKKLGLFGAKRFPKYPRANLKDFFKKIPELMEPALRCLQINPSDRPWITQVFSPISLRGETISKSLAIVETYQEVDQDRIDLGARRNALEYVLGRLFLLDLANASTFAYFASLYDRYCTKKKVSSNGCRRVAVACVIIAITIVERVSLRTYLKKLTKAPFEDIRKAIVRVIKALNCNLHPITFVDALASDIDGLMACICIGAVFHRQFLEYPPEDLARVAKEIHQATSEESLMLSPEANEIVNQMLTLMESGGNYRTLVEYFEAEDDIENI